MTFAQIHSAFQPWLLGLGEGQYLYFTPDKMLYAQYGGLDELMTEVDRFERDDAVSLVRAAMIDQCGPDVAAAVFRKVTDQVQKTGRDFRQGLTRGDLELLHQELPRQQRQYLELWKSITVPGPNDGSPRDMLERFKRLKAMADDDRQAHFTTVVEQPDPDGRWAFAFKIGSFAIYQSDRLENRSGQYWSEFALGAALEANYPSADTVERIRSGKEFSDCNFETQHALDDDWSRSRRYMCSDVFNSKNFLRVEQEDPSHFLAFFKRPDGSEASLAFTDNRSTVGRPGEKLKEVLQNGKYSCLDDIARYGHLSTDDWFLKQHTDSMWARVAQAMGFDSIGLSEYLGKLEGDERDAVTAMLRGITFGSSTSLADLYLPAAAGAPGTNPPGANSAAGLEVPSRGKAGFVKATIVASSQTFTDIYKTYKPSLFESGQYVRGPVTKDGDQVPLAQAELNQIGAKLVKQAIATEYGNNVAQDAFRDVGRMRGRILDKGVTCGDLELLHEWLPHRVKIDDLNL
jgi:hypothetical protein